MDSDRAPFGGSGAYRGQGDPAGAGLAPTPPGAYVPVLDPTAASGWARLGAGIVDSILGAAWTFAISFVLLVLLYVAGYEDSPSGLLIGYPIYLSYRIGSTLMWRATPGKAMLGMRVVDWHDREASAGQVWGRELSLAILSVIPLVGFINLLMIAFAMEHRGMHDRMSSTYVVK
jgi:uncharacterized RDD family membrane protein YckC